MKIRMKYEKDLDIIDEDEYGNELLSDEEDDDEEEKKDDAQEEQEEE